MAANVYTVQTQGTDVDFAPSSTVAEILQNVRTIMGTIKYSVPLDREFGIDVDYLDKPMPVVQASMASDLLTTLKKYEPRVDVTAITFSGDETGKLVPKVEVRLVDGIE